MTKDQLEKEIARLQHQLDAVKEAEDNARIEGIWEFIKEHGHMEWHPGLNGVDPELQFTNGDAWREFLRRWRKGYHCSITLKHCTIQICDGEVSLYFAGSPSYTESMSLCVEHGIPVSFEEAEARTTRDLENAQRAVNRVQNARVEYANLLRQHGRE